MSKELFRIAKGSHMYISLVNIKVSCSYVANNSRDTTTKLGGSDILGCSDSPGWVNVSNMYIKNNNEF